MVHESTDVEFTPSEGGTATESGSDEIAKLRSDFQARLVAADLRTEAVRAGIVDLDGLKLIDISSVRLGGDDKVAGARKIIDELRRNKPWLFPGVSSSSPALAPASQPVRQKTALEMSDEEYIVARAAITKRHY